MSEHSELMTAARLAEIDRRYGSGGGYTGAPTKRELRLVIMELVEDARHVRKLPSTTDGTTGIETEAAREGRGPGVPAAMHLEAFGAAIADAFGECPYHVGSSATQKTGWRDVDVRLILDDDRFHALFPGFKAANHIDAWWALLCAALSELGRQRTGLPIDFQIQSMTEANERYPGVRHPLFLIRARDEHQPTMTGPVRKEEDGA